MKFYFGFILIFLVLQTLASKDTPSPCVIDLGEALAQLGYAASATEGAVKECEHNGTQCAVYVSDIVKYLAGATGYLAAALKECGGVNNTQCTQDIAFIISDVANLSSYVSKTLLDCNPFSYKCVEDVAVIGVTVAELVAELTKTIKECESSCRNILNKNFQC
eukprot:TRINITY_DN894_c0_g1_i1.p1 TRINITY_DN894_c0_g1~~TRINITY_DN894_c0_g1_i1.p1  ORF type:complete len:171 (-),score=33.47 TRINITY_DN894_c0_g1_i1:65-553(-)